ncbi:hypothetical protein BGW80DRAFT_221700 [Lactifluus volemus]|nr:hypothetical protein BGW80DRAFT_221700 [Lactifluus volemus]
MHAYTPTGEPYTHHASSTSTQDSSHQFIEQQHSPPRNPRYLHADSQYTSPSYSPGRRGSISPSSQVSLQPQLHPHQPQPQLQSYQSQPHVEWAEQRYPPSHHSSSHVMSPHSQHRDPLPRQYQDASVPYHPTHSTYSQSENRGRQSYQQPRQQLQTSPHRSPAPPYPDFEPASSQPAISQYQSTSPTQPPCHFPRCSLPVIRNNTNELTEYCGEQHMFAAIQQLGIPVCVMCRTLPQRIRVESEYCGAACEWEAWQRLQRQDNERADYRHFPPPRPVAGRVIYPRDEEPQYERSESSSSASRRHIHREF